MSDPTRSVAATHSLADPASTVGGEGDSPATAAPPTHARYQLGDEIARGGMGEVYRAADTTLGREVAVKVLQPKYSPASATARRFHDEARIAAQLQHPGIPAVHDLGTLPDGRPFLAMKLIKGNTLADLLAGRERERPEFGRFVAVFEQIAHAVAYAHAHGVIHRDLKPANVMVGNFAEVQVMDWGLAKVLGERRDVSPPVDPHDPDATRDPDPTEIKSLRDTDDLRTQAGIILGTPAFMPPEQAIGAVKNIDARSDVFGLGAILAVILTGKPPFVGGSTETMRVKAAQGDVADCFARLDTCGAEPELVALCKRCLSPKPADRPAHAGEVADAVAKLRAAADERARHAEIARETATVQAAEQRKRRRWQRAVLAILMLATVAVAGVAGWVAWVAEERARLAGERAQFADELGRANARLETDLYFRQIGLAQLELAAGQSDRAAALLDEVRPDLRRWEWHLARRLCSGEPNSFSLGSDTFVECLAYLPPDGRRLAVGGYGGNRGRVWVVAPDSGRVVHELSGHGNGLVHEVAAAVTTDRVVVLTACGDGVARVFDAGSGALVKEFAGPGGAGNSCDTVSASPDGRFAATGYDDGSVHIWEIGTGRTIHVLTGHVTAARRVRFSPDGRSVASAGWDGSIRVWDLTADPPHLRSVLRHDDQVLGLAWSPDGRRLAAAGGMGSRTEVRLWDAVAGSSLFIRRGHTSLTEQTSFSPDGRMVATVSGHPNEPAVGEVIVWEAATGQQALALRGQHAHPPRALAFRADGGQLATGDERGRVLLWDTTAAAPATVLPWRPTDAHELMARARRLGQHQGDHAAAYALIVAALKDRPELAIATDPPRLFAAGCAVCAARGHRPDAVNAQDAARWRERALALVREEFAAADRPPAPATRLDCLRRIDNWGRDNWFATVHNPEEMAKLPADERMVWEIFWANLAAALTTTDERRADLNVEKKNLPMREVLPPPRPAK